MFGIIITPKEELCLLFYYTKRALFPIEDMALFPGHQALIPQQSSWCETGHW